MAEVISTASFDIDTTKATKNVETLANSIEKLDKELVELQKAGKDTSAVEAKLAQQTAQLNKALSQTSTTTKGAAAQTAAYTKAQQQLGAVSDKTASQVEKTNISVRQSATVFRRGVAGVKGFGKSIAQDLGGSINAVKGGIETFSSQIAGVAAGFGPYGIAIAGAVTVLSPFVAGLFEASEAQKVAAEQAEAFQKSTEAAIGSIVEETRANNGLFAALRSGETDQKTRIAIVKQLNADYPEIIGNTNLLTASEGELARIQAAVNDQIKTRILLKAKEQQTSELVAKLALVQIDIARKQGELDKTAASEAARRQATEAELIKQGKETFTLNEQIIQIEIARGKTREQAIKDLQAAEEARRAAQAKDLQENNEVFSKEREQQEALLKEIALLESAYGELSKTLTGVDFGSSTTALDELTDGNKKAAASAKEAAKEQQALAGTLAALRAEQSKLNEQIEKSTRLDDTARLKELATRQKAVTKEIQDAEAAIKALTETQQPYVRSLAELRKASGELQKILDEQIDADDIENITRYSIQIAELGDEIKRVEKAIADANKQKLSLLPPEQGAKEIAALRAEAEAVKIELGELAIERNRALLSLQVQENAAIAKVTDNEKEKERIRKEFAARRAALERQSAIQNTQVQIQQAQAELAVLQASGDAEISQLNEQIAKVEELRLELAKLEGEPVTVDVEVNTKDVDKKTKEAIQKAADFAQELSGQIIDFVSSANQAALQAADNAVSRQEEILNELLANEQTASAQQVELERERLDKLNAEREKAKNQEAIIAQAQIAINLALAVARAVAEGGGVASAVTVGLAISAALFGFLKAKQASEQAFFEGTTNVRRAAGEPVGRDTVRARLNEGEAVIPTATNKAYSPAVKAIYHGTIPAEALNAFVTDYQSGRVSSKALRTVRDGSAQQQIIVVQPDASVGEYVAKELQKLPQMQLRGDGIHRIVSSKSAKLEKTKKRAKGF